MKNRSWPGIIKEESWRAGLFYISLFRIVKLDRNKGRVVPALPKWPRPVRGIAI